MGNCCIHWRRKVYVTRADQEEKIIAYSDALRFRDKQLDDQEVHIKTALDRIERESSTENDKYIELTNELIEVRQRRGEIRLKLNESRKILEENVDSRALAFFALHELGDMACVGGELKRAEKQAAKEEHDRRDAQKFWKI